jgi:hypothetical protein
MRLTVCLGSSQSRCSLSDITTTSSLLMSSFSAFSHLPLGICGRFLSSICVYFPLSLGGWFFLIYLLITWFCREKCRFGRVWQPQSGQRWSHYRPGYRARRSHGKCWRCFNSRSKHYVLRANVLLFSCQAQTKDILHFLDLKTSTHQLYPYHSSMPLDS